MDPVSSIQTSNSTSPITAAMYRADWYPDPTLRFEFRYHNGAAWTGDVALDGQRYLDPLATAFGPSPTGPARAAGTGKAKAAFVLGLASVVVGWMPFLCILAVAAAVLAVVFATSFLRRGRNVPGRGFAVAGLILAPIGLLSSALGVWLTVVTIREVDQYTNVGPYSVELSSCSSGDGTAIASGIITNESGRTKDFRVIVDFEESGGGDPMATETAEVARVEPGATAEWSVFAITSHDDLACHVRDVTGPLPFGQS